MHTVFTCMAFELPYSYVIGTNKCCIKYKPRYKCQINSHITVCTLLISLNPHPQRCSKVNNTNVNMCL